MLQRLQRAVEGLDVSAAGAGRAFELVRRSENPWRDAKEPLAKCMLLVCADELDRMVPNASVRIAGMMHESYDRVSAHHEMTTQLLSNIEPALAASDYNQLVHTLAAWDARRIATALAELNKPDRDPATPPFALAEVLEHPRYLVDEAVLSHAREAMGDAASVPHVCNVLGKLVPGMVQLLSARDDVLVEFAKACVEYCAGSDDLSREVDNSLADVVDEWLQAVEADRFTDAESRLLTWQQLTFVLEQLGRHLFDRVLQRYPGFPLLLMLGATEDAAEADPALWSTTVHCLEVAVTYGGVQFWAASEMLPDSVLDVLLPCFQSRADAVRSIAVGVATTVVSASELVLREADVGPARNALLNSLSAQVARSDSLLAHQAICQLLQGSLMQTRLSEWLLRCEDQWLPLFLWRASSAEDRTRHSELADEVALELVSKLASVLYDPRAPASTEATKSRAHTLLTKLTDAAPDSFASEEVVKALVRGHTRACLLSTDPDDPAQTSAQAASFQRTLDVQHQAIATMLVRLSSVAALRHWDVRMLLESDAEGWATLLCCGSDAVADATADLLLTLAQTSSGSQSTGARSKLRVLFEALCADNHADGLLTTLFHGLAVCMSRLLKMDATTVYHLLERSTRVAKMVWGAVGQTVDPTDRQVAAYAEKSWLLFCTVMNDKFKSHLRFSETVQSALELACECWPIWQQTVSMERLRNGILQPARYRLVIDMMTSAPTRSAAVVAVQMCDTLSGLPIAAGSRPFLRLYQALLDHSDLTERSTLDRLAQAEADFSSTLLSLSSEIASSDPLQDLDVIEVETLSELAPPASARPAAAAARQASKPIVIVNLQYPTSGTSRAPTVRRTPWTRRQQPQMQWINGKQVPVTLGPRQQRQQQYHQVTFTPRARPTSKLEEVKRENALFEPTFSAFGDDHVIYDVDAEWEREQQLLKQKADRAEAQEKAHRSKQSAIDLSKFLGISASSSPSSSSAAAAAVASTVTGSAATALLGAPVKTLLPMKASATTGSRAFDLQLKSSVARRVDFNPTLFIFQELSAVQLREFQRTVLSWPLPVIFQGPLHDAPTTPLPDRFLHDQQYVRSFEGLFFEELRSAMVQDMQAVLRDGSVSQQSVELLSQGVVSHASDGICTLEFRRADDGDDERGFSRNSSTAAVLPWHGNHLVLLYDELCSLEDFSPQHQALALLQGEGTNFAQPSPTPTIKLHAITHRMSAFEEPEQEVGQEQAVTPSGGLLDRLCAGNNVTCRCIVVQNLSTALREYTALHSVSSLRLAPYILKATPTISVASLQRLQLELEGKLKAEDTQQALELLRELAAMNVDIVVLQQTGIVELINALRKHEQEDIRQQASIIRQTWKSQIKEDYTARSFKGGVLANTSGTPSRPSGVPPKLWQQLCRRYNSSQLWAIHYACSFRSRHFDTDISLLQGPPGTGKTRTILGITSALLAQVHKSTGASIARNYRLMICAPSNAAVDELVIRLRRDGLVKADGEAFTPRVIRLGQVTNDSSSEVLECSLDHQLDQKLQEEGAAQRLAQIQQQLRDVSGKMRQAATGKDRRVLMLQKKDLYRQRSQLMQQVERSRARLKNELILGADIVVCTLSASGSSVMEDLVGLHRILFDAVIIDEAAQACELSTLIPLRYGCRKLILVGDPRQLPATVLSNHAQALGYATSLFERLERVGHEIVMLKVQYRMHPSIRVFPSARFYQSALSDAPFITRAHNAWQSQEQHPPKDEAGLCWRFHDDRCFAPFVFYDVAGRESRSGNSVNNEHEVDFIVALLRGLERSAGVELARQCSIAIITPYRAQVRLLKNRLASSPLAVRENIEVNTVDGFQGREKDIVIISCVRSSGSGAIGFLRDPRRMNVAITRARSSLWVCGNAHALAHDEDWRALVENARERHVYVRTRSDESFDALQRRLATTTPEQDSRSLPALPTMAKRKADDALGKQAHASNSKQPRAQHRPGSATASAVATARPSAAAAQITTAQPPAAARQAQSQPPLAGPAVAKQAQPSDQQPAESVSASASASASGGIGTTGVSDGSMRIPKKRRF